MNWKPLLGIVITVVALTCFYGASEAQNALPIPVQTEIVIQARPGLINNDSYLQPLISSQTAVNHYLNLLGLRIEHVSTVVIFTSNDGLPGTTRVENFERLPQTGGFLLTGDFDPKRKLQALRQLGWKEKEHAGKKILWWSTGDTYLISPGGEECVSALPENRLLVTGSEMVMRNVLDISGGKKPGLASQGAFGTIAGLFEQDSLISMAAYVPASAEIRETIKAAVASSPTPSMEKALEYVDHVQNIGACFSGSGPYLLDSYFGMDSDNNALIAASILQIGGDLASLLSKKNPAYEVLANMNTTREGSVIRIRSQFSRAQMIELMKRK